MSRALFSLAVLALLAVSALAGNPGGVASTVSSLGAFQAYSGGFTATEGGEPTLEATENALFLSSLFGAADQVNAESVATFVQSLQNSDNGFANTPGAASDIASVRNALLAYAHIGKKVSNTAAIASFVDSCFDKSTNLYGSAPGSAGELKATALALQVLKQIDALDSKNDVKKAISQHLNEIVEEDNGVKSFATSTSENAYAIIAAILVDYDLGDDVQEYARFFYARQNADGGFNSGNDIDDTTNIADAAITLEALAALQKATQSNNLIDAIDSRGLLGNVARIPVNDVNLVALGFKAAARTRAINEVFQALLTFDPESSAMQLAGERIISGSQVSPVFAVRTAWGTPHSGFDVSATIKHGKETTSMKLIYNAEQMRYNAENAWDTGSYLGKITLEAVARVAIPDFDDDLTLRFSDVKTVGYDLDISVKAVGTNGQEIPEGESVAQGTTFTASVALGTISTPKPALLSGDFDITFQVKDSSLVLIHETKLDGRKNEEPIAFTYTLSQANIPAGTITLSVAISNNAGTHTSEKVTYSLNVPMVATEIKVGQSEYKIGETVEVTMVPASLPDLRSVHPYSGYDVRQKQAVRRFFMDVVSSNGNTITIIPGSSDFDDDDKLFYKFAIPLSASIDSLGSPALRFRYASADGTSIPLQNYDSAAGEPFEASRVLSYTVKSDLRLKNLQATSFPSDGKLNYGQNVLFSFQVVDQLSGQTLVGSGENTVYLALKSEDKSGTYISARVPAVAARGADEDDDTKFRIDWVVNPNAVRGKASLELIAVGGDGRDIEIAQEDGTPYRNPVTVGGDLEHDDFVQSNAVIDPRTLEESAVFTVQFKLRSGETPLTGAKLFARVSNKNGEVLTAPVVEGKDDDGENVGYSVSWILPKEAAPSGTYKVDFFRESDRRRLASNVDVEPFFTVNVPYSGPTTSSLPIRTEYLILTALGAGFITAVFRKLETEGARRK